MSQIYKESYDILRKRLAKI